MIAIKRFILFALLLIGPGLYSQVQRTEDVCSSLVVGSVLEVESDYDYYDQTGLSGVEDSPENKVRLYWEETSGIDFLSAFSIEYPCTLKLYGVDGALLREELISMKVDYHPESGKTYVSEDLYTTDGGYKMELYPGTPVITGSVTHALDQLVIAIELDPKREVELDITESPRVEQRYDETTNELVLSWPQVEGTKEYDIKWHYQSAYTENTVLPREMDYTRIRQLNNEYRITCTFDEGTILYYIRSIGEKDGIPLFGAWYGEGQGEENTYYLTQDWQKERSWTYSVTYNENGQKDEGVSYVDAIKNIRQTLAVDPVTNTVLVKEFFYDYDGQSSLTVMPGMVPGQRLEFYESFTIDGNDNAYGRRNFGTDDKLDDVSGPDLINTDANSAGQYHNNYFSSNNPFLGDGLTDYVADAEGYLMSQTMFDKKGRPRKSNGVGKNYAITGTHTTEMWYQPVLQEKLNSLFGNDAGDARFYRRVVTKNPDGIYSAAYLNQAGQTVATSVLTWDHPSFDKPSQVRETGDDWYTYTPDPSEIHDLSALNISTWNGLEVDYAHVVKEGDSPISMNYELTRAQYDAVCDQIPGGNCAYVLEIYVTNDVSGARETLPDGSTLYTKKLNETDVNWDNDKWTIDASMQVPYSLDPGSYTIHKRLRIDIEAYFSAKGGFEELLLTGSGDPNNPYCVDTPDSYPDLLASYDINYECEPCKQDCYLSIKDLPAHQPSAFTDAQGNFDAVGFKAAIDLAVNTCYDAECAYAETPSYYPTDCEGIKELLKADMSPKGQYFEGEEFTGSKDPDVSVNRNHSVADGDDAQYWWLAGYIAEDPSSLMGINESLWKDVAANWNDAKAEILVQYHPEYAQYEWCALTKDHMDHNLDLQKLSYEEVKAGGWIDFDTPGSIVENLHSNTGLVDPLSVNWNGSLLGGSYGQSGQNWINFVTGKYVEFIDLGTAASPDPVGLYDFAYDEAGLVSEVVGSPTAEEVWDSYRFLYMALRVNFLSELRRTQSLELRTDYDPFADQTFENADGAFLDENGDYKDTEVRIINMVSTNPNNKCDGPMSSSDTRQCKGAGFIARFPDVGNKLNDFLEDVQYGDSEAAFYQLTQGWPCPPIWTAASCTITDRSSELGFIGYGLCDDVYNPRRELFTAVSQGDGTVVLYSPIENSISYNGLDVCMIQDAETLDPGNPNPGEDVYTPLGEFADGKVELDEDCPLNDLSKRPHCHCNIISSFANRYDVFMSEDPSYDWSVDYPGYIIDTRESFVLAALETVYGVKDENTGEYYFTDASGSTTLELTLQMVSNQLISCDQFNNPTFTDAPAESLPPSGTYLKYLPKEMDCTLYDPIADCEKEHEDNLAEEAADKHSSDLQTKLNEFGENYYADCLANLEESFTISGTMVEYQYTLYFYDLTGAMTGVVSPEGVRPLNPIDDAADLAAIDAHRADRNQPAVLWEDIHKSAEQASEFEYNALGQTKWQRTPDEGEGEYYYDEFGRSIATQNALQKESDAFSYTLYDKEDRIKEVGQISVPSTFVVSSVYDLFESNVNLYDKQEVTRSYYDISYSGEDLLVNRDKVTWVAFHEEDLSSDRDLINEFDNAYVFEYNDYGWVQKQVQINNAISNVDYKYVTSSYSYNIHTGILEEVVYQEGKVDQFITRLKYDANDRITKVLTSSDGVLWDEDVNYQYYKHGITSRIELGDQQVQGIDFAYTLQGQLKGINSASIDSEGDIGKDGLAFKNDFGGVVGRRSYFARDVYGLILGYYRNGEQGTSDYKSIGTANYLTGDYSFEPDLSSFNASSELMDLHAGNISYMITSIYDDLDGTATSGAELQANPQLYAYRHDVLQRLTEVQAFGFEGTFSKDWWNLTQKGGVTKEVSDYYCRYEYDLNGNITRLTRNGFSDYYKDGNPNGSGSQVLHSYQLDDIKYKYDRSGEDLTGNRLYHVYDVHAGSGDDSEYYGDIKIDQDLVESGIASNGARNYFYDALGNIEQDVKEGIEKIEWTVKKRIKSVKRFPSSPGDDLEYVYDPFGKRIAKIVKKRQEAVEGSGTYEYAPISEWKYFYYTYSYTDEQIAFYEGNLDNVQLSSVSGVKTKEHIIYGDSRFGVKRFKDFAPLEAGHNKKINGQKSYELVNHLGNVLTVISDKKLWVDSEGGYYMADIQQSTDYYAYGMAMSGRGYKGSDDYRYGFNGMEKDNEVKGSGNHYTTNYRQMDPRLGRWFSPDPVFQPYQSPYTSMDCNPIGLNDPLGLETGIDELPGEETDSEITVEVKKEKGNNFFNINAWRGFLTFFKGDGEFSGSSEGYAIGAVTYDYTKWGKKRKWVYQGNGKWKDISDKMYEGWVYSQSKGKDVYIATSVDYWDGIPEGLVGHNGYTYSLEDLKMRHRIMSGGNHALKQSILNYEAEGWAEPLTQDTYWDTYGETLGKIKLVAMYIEMGAEMASSNQGNSGRQRGGGYVKSRLKAHGRDGSNRMTKDKVMECHNESNCFVAGTQVATSEGFRAIENIKPGDQVWAWDESSGDVGLKSVVRTFVREVDQLIYIEFEGGEIATTDEHPFWVDGRWVVAKDLHVGQMLFTQDSTYHEIISYSIKDTGVTVYNFEVEDYHTYFVTDDAVLVHNNCFKKASTPSAVHSAIKSKWGHNMTRADMKEIKNTAKRIRNGDTSRYPDNDGTHFQNAPERSTPTAQRLNTGENYTEWTVRTPNMGNRGERRILVGDRSGKAYYTHDHYEGYIEIDLSKW